MLIYVLFGQRNCAYDGEWAPEALEVADEYTMDENPDWIEDKRKEHAEIGSFSSLKIITIDLGKGSHDAISNILNECHSIDGSIVKK